MNIFKANFLRKLYEIILLKDSKIVHPVALRMSPDGQAVPVDGAPDRSRTFSGEHENLR